MAQEDIWVRAVRVGFYGGQRRYPANYPSEKAPHPKAGLIFKLEKPEHFSDANRPTRVDKGRVISSGWMVRVAPPSNPEQYKMVEDFEFRATVNRMAAVAAGGSATAVTAATLSMAQETARAHAAPVVETVTAAAPQTVTIGSPVNVLEQQVAAPKETVVRRRGGRPKKG